MATIDPHDGSDVDGQVEWFHNELMTALRAVLERTSKHLDPSGPVQSSNIMRTFWKGKVNGLVDKLEIVVIDAADRTRALLQSHVDANTPVAVNAGGDLLRAQLKAAGRRSFVKTRALTADAFEIPSPVDLFAEIYLRSRRGFLLDLGTDAWNIVRGELIAGMNDGEGIGDLRSRVMSVADVAQPRAERIARTEVVGATNAGAIEQVRASKLDATKTWLATKDSRTRQSHADVDGTTVPLDGTFLVGGVRMDRPHDPTAPADEVIQCRCTLTFEISDDDALTAAMFGKASQPRDSHGRWAATGAKAYSHAEVRTDKLPDPAQRAALDEYVDDIELNEKVRALKGPFSRKAVAIQRAFDTVTPIDEPIMVHRAISNASDVFGTDNFVKLKGATIKDHGFMSTTTDKNVAEGFRFGDDGVVVNIHVPAGQRAMAIDKARGKKASSEQELLFDSGTSLKVNDVTQGPNGTIIEAEMV